VRQVGYLQGLYRSARSTEHKNTTSTADNTAGPGQEWKYYPLRYKVTLLNQTEIRTGDIPETSISALWSNTK
jgi:hypothetical protein